MELCWGRFHLPALFWGRRLISFGNLGAASQWGIRLQLLESPYYRQSSRVTNAWSSVLCLRKVALAAAPRRAQLLTFVPRLIPESEISLEAAQKRCLLQKLFVVQLGLLFYMCLSGLVVRLTHFPLICYGKLIYKGGRKLAALQANDEGLGSGWQPVLPVFQSLCQNPTHHYHHHRGWSSLQMMLWSSSAQFSTRCGFGTAMTCLRRGLRLSVCVSARERMK